MTTLARGCFTLLLGVFVLLWQSAATAVEWNVQTLMSELGRRSSGEATFSETKYLAALSEPIEQSGTLAFAPGHLEKFTRHPRQERLTVDGDVLTIETGSDRKRRRLQLQRYPMVWALIEGMRATLTGDLDTLELFYGIELHGSPDDWELVMVPIEREMAAAVSLISIRGQLARITIVEVVQEGGDRSVLRIKEDVP